VTYLCIIQARLGSTRFPGKVLQLVKGRTMLKRVWDAAKASWADKVVVLWPERYSDIAENDLFSRFARLINEFSPTYVIRLTADCPLLATSHINDAIRSFEYGIRRNPPCPYFNNGMDGFDVQIFTPEFMYTHPNREHVLDVQYNAGGLSVNTPADLAKVRQLAR
jgi:spore coat polysaccharide biosynthesis protein SpsF (cytidylyltransferase family)